MKKLFEIKFGQWERALSYETTAFVDGIFRQFINCDPFNEQGIFAPTKTVVEIGSGVINPVKAIRVILPVYASAQAWYALGDDYKLYKIADTNDAVTDVSAQIGTGTATAIDVLKWKGGLVYAMSNVVRTNAIPVASQSDAHLLSVNPTSNLCIGPDRDVYVGVSNNVAYIRQAGSTGVAVAASLETGNTVRKLLSDGRYLVWIAEDGGVTDPTGKNLITVAWWNLASAEFDQIWQFEGGVLSGAEKIGSKIKIITSSGIWHTNIATEPFLAVPFGGTIATSDVPVSIYSNGSIGKYKGNFLFWGTNQSSGNIFMIGNKIPSKPDRLFQMGTSPQFSISAISSNNTKFIVAAGTLNPSAGIKLYNLRGSASNNTAVANVAGFSLGQPFTFHSAKVVLKSPIASGDSVSLQILASNSTKTILASTTKSNTTDSGERSLIFDSVAAGDGSDVRNFEDISDVKLTTNVAVHSITVYGDPVDERSSYA